MNPVLERKRIERNNFLLFQIIYDKMRTTESKKRSCLCLAQTGTKDPRQGEFKEETILKLLSIAIPCYNSAAYMENCIKSLLPGGNEVEILIVDDGSTKDNTAEIADRYEKEYPGICKAIHQENGGHGAAVNAGLKAASGIFFKVVDSDDWVNEQAYRQVLDTLRRFVYGKDTLDMLITNLSMRNRAQDTRRS